LLNDALDAYEKNRRAEPMRKAGVSEEGIGRVFGNYSKKWWGSLNDEQYEAERAKRSAAAKKRWAKPRPPKAS